MIYSEAQTVASQHLLILRYANIPVLHEDIVHVKLSGLSPAGWGGRALRLHSAAFTLLHRGTCHHWESGPTAAANDIFAEFNAACFFSFLNQIYSFILDHSCSSPSYTPPITSPHQPLCSSHSIPPLFLFRKGKASHGY